MCVRARSFVRAHCIFNRRTNGQETERDKNYCLFGWNVHLLVLLSPFFIRAEMESRVTACWPYIWLRNRVISHWLHPRTRVPHECNELLAKSLPAVWLYILLFCRLTVQYILLFCHGPAITRSIIAPIFIQERERETVDGNRILPHFQSRSFHPSIAGEGTERPLLLCKKYASLKVEAEYETKGERRRKKYGWSTLFIVSRNGHEWGEIIFKGFS